MDYPNSWLVYTIFKTFSWILLESAFFKLLQDLLSFVSPQLLKWVTSKQLLHLYSKSSQTLLCKRCKLSHMFKVSVSSLDIAAVYPVLTSLPCTSNPLLSSPQADDRLHQWQKHICVAGLPLCRAAVCGGSAAVHLPTAVLPALLCVGHESPYCHHGCCVQKGKIRERLDITFTFLTLMLYWETDWIYKEIITL